MIGWDEVAAIDDLHATSIAQHWNDVHAPGPGQATGRQGHPVAGHARLPRHEIRRRHPGGRHLGRLQRRAGRLRVGPRHPVPGLVEADVLGVEAPLWSETIRTREEVELLPAPRSPATRRSPGPPRPADLGRIPRPPRQPGPPPQRATGRTCTARRDPLAVRATRERSSGQRSVVSKPQAVLGVDSFRSLRPGPPGEKARMRGGRTASPSGLILPLSIKWRGVPWAAVHGSGLPRGALRRRHGGGPPGGRPAGLAGGVAGGWPWGVRAAARFQAVR